MNNHETRLVLAGYEIEERVTFEDFKPIAILRIIITHPATKIRFSAEQKVALSELASTDMDIFYLLRREIYKELFEKHKKPAYDFSMMNDEDLQIMLRDAMRNFDIPCDTTYIKVLSDEIEARKKAKVT